MSNTITAYFKGRVGVAESVYQYDYGMVMNFDSIDLPAHFDCYFSMLNQEEAIPGVGADGMVAIPNSVLANPGAVTIHIPIHTGANDSEVEYIVYFKVIGRARPIDDGTPAQMTAIEQALALLQNSIGNIEQIVSEALSFTGETFEEMQEDLDEWKGGVEEGLDTWKGGVESDFDNLDAQFQTAIGAVTVDDELLNVRVGDDNVTYATAGEAVRKQFSNLKSELSDFETPSLLNLIKANPLIYGGFINGNNGAYQAGTSGSGLDCCTPYIPVDSGAVYYLRRPSNAVITWNVVQYDSSKSFISGAFATNPTTMDANAKYIRISLASGESGYDKCIFSRLDNIEPNKQTVLENVYVREVGLTADNLMLGLRTSANPYQLDGTISSRCTTISPIFYRKGTEITLRNNLVAAITYDTSLNLISVYPFRSWTKIKLDQDCFVNFVFGYVTDATITSADFNNFVNSVSIIPPEFRADFEAATRLASYAGMRNGSVFNLSNASAVATTNIIPIGREKSFEIVINRPLSSAGHCYRFQYSTFTVDSGLPEEHPSDRVAVDVTTVMKPDTYRIAINPKTSDSIKGWAFAIYEVTDSSASSYVPIRFADIGEDAVLILPDFSVNEDESNNYIVGSDLMRRPIKAEQLGSLTYLQAFCIYNGSYYSIDGSHISVQNSSFTQTDAADLYTGHGNGLQLGSGKYAYASGWNDNNIYKVDLDNLVIDSTIALPTTGYTTGVVDEVNNLAYIFQRDSYPDHEDNYNFIVYDITNQQIVSTKKILAYGAMQAADFFNDRIIVLNGLGTSACPNGYRVFDTNGNILADYYFGDFSTIEPEGVCIDRNNHELHISFVDKKLYKVY